MTTGATPDDLDALRTILETLEPFDTGDRERILRWTMEKLGVRPSTNLDPSIATNSTGTPPPNTLGGQNQDIKTFVSSKNPQSDNQLSAVVAYYYKFEAPQKDRKDAITTDDVLNVCRLAGLSRPKRPAQTLVNAHSAGLLDKGTDRGTYQINSVGENLVAVSLPSSAASTPAKRKKAAKKGKTKKSKR
jgi:hypothetical protein